MKTTIKKSVLVVTMFFALINYANEKKISKTNSVKVEFTYVKKGETLTIRNSEQTIIYKKVIENAGNYSKKFDLSALKNGTYTAELSKSFAIKIKAFTIKNGLATFLEEETVFKPSIKNEKNVVFISKATFKKEALKVTIYFEESEIFSETIEDDSFLKRAYKLAETEKGNYKVVVNSKSRIYTKEFRL
jgi:hypothetical protein